MRHLLVLLLGLTLLTPAVADIYVGNDPYGGEVSGAGGELRFILAELAEALELEIGQDETGWTLGGAPVPTVNQDGEVWVELTSLPKEVVRVVVQRELNTVDLFRVGTVRKPAVERWGGEGTVVYFCADWSPACQAMENSISMLERATTIRLARLNIDNPYSPTYRKYVNLFEGDKIPYFVLLDENDRKLDAFAGFMTYNDLLERLKKAFSG